MQKLKPIIFAAIIGLIGISGSLYWHFARPTPVYENTFSTFDVPGVVVDRDSIGEGVFNSDVRVEGPFYPQYKAYSAIWPDGTHAIRMPTKSEIPGGYHYSTLYGYVSFYGRFPTLDRVTYRWKIRLPRIFDYSADNYNGHAWLFRSQTDAKELFSVRFLNNRTIGFFLNNAPLPTRLEFDRPLAGDSVHELSIELEHGGGGRIRFAFDDKEAVVRYGDSYETPTREWVAPAGNALRNDENLDYFSSLGPVSAYYDGIERKSN